MDSLLKEITTPDFYDKLSFKRIQEFANMLDNKDAGYNERILSEVMAMHQMVEAINLRTRMIEKHLDDQDELLQGFIAKAFPKLANL